MLNEYVYCPRLFYYEQVEGVFVHNSDTLAGAAQHKRVNQSEDGLPAAEATVEDNIHARSVALFSERLGVSAKLDLVEIQPPTIAASQTSKPESPISNPPSPIPNPQSPIRNPKSPVSSDSASVLKSEISNLKSPTLQPVEYKKGAPRETDDGNALWDTDRMQLGLQILLLRDNGFSCQSGVLYYRETKQRVTFTLDAETENWILANIEAARRCLQGPIPPPLDHSPKCPRCSLSGICLPDETRMLQTPANYLAPPSPQLEIDFPPSDPPQPDTPTEPATPPTIERSAFDSIPEIQLPSFKTDPDLRRLIAPNEETRALYLNTPGQYVGKSGETLVVKEDGKKVAEFRLLDLHHVALFGPVALSTPAIQTLCEEDIPITYFSTGGWFYGMTRGHSLKNVFTRIEQFRHAADPALALLCARLLVHGKIRNQRTLLLRNHLEPPKGMLKALKYCAASALTAPSLGGLLGVEGVAAGLYFEHFAGMLKTNDSFSFQDRNRRPPRDPINALLSLVYSLLAKDCTLACYAVGFDPYVGFLHQPRHGRPALALDLMEEFRPLVADSVVLTLVNNQMVKPSDFITAGSSVALTPAGRKTVFLAYEKRLAEAITHPVFGYRVSYRRAIELQARMLAKTLTGEIEQYVPFLTR